LDKARKTQVINQFEQKKGDTGSPSAYRTDNSSYRTCRRPQTRLRYATRYSPFGRSEKKIVIVSEQERRRPLQ
jgi:hypothetical protein